MAKKSQTDESESSNQSKGNVCDALWKRPIRGVPQPSTTHSYPNSLSAKAFAPALVGLEMEMFAYDARNYLPLGLPGSIYHPSELLKRMSDSVEGAKLKVDPATGVVVGLTLATGANFSLEPGGQVEFSSAPRSDSKELIDDVVFGLQALEQAARGEVVFLSHGTNPIAPRDLPLLVPKERYQILRRYFLSEPQGRGADMMGHTATVQPNIDITGDDTDWEDAVRLTFALTPAVQSLTRNSFYFAGQRSRYPSERQQIWLSTDRTRSGIPEGITRAQDVACHYATWARRANVFLVRGLPVDEQPLYGEISFERYLSEGYKGVMPTLQDWELHLATLFPELRLRGFLEIRNLDAQPFEHLFAGVALWKGLLLDPIARAEAWSLLSTQALPQRIQETLNKELVNLATEAVRRMGDAVAVAALEAAVPHWLASDESRSLPDDPLKFVKDNATHLPSEKFVESMVRAGIRWDRSRGHPGWGRNKR